MNELKLDGCDKLTLPESFIQLQLPDDNFMKCCKQVARLPESIVEHHLFKDATSLDFSSAKLVALPERIGQLVNLDEKSMKGILEQCKRFESIPSTLFGHPYFRTVTKLDLSGWRMTALPEGIGHLVNLEKLDISYTSIVTLPEGTMHQTIH